MQRNLNVSAYGPRRIVSAGDHAAAFGWFRLQSLSTGRSADIGYAIYFELREGLITKYHFLENTLDVANAFRVGGSWLIDADGLERTIPDPSR